MTDFEWEVENWRILGLIIRLIFESRHTVRIYTKL